MKRLLGCSFLSMMLMAGTAALGVGCLLSYRALLRETIEVEAGWSRIENIYQRRRTLAMHFRESARGELGSPEVERALDESCNRASQIILSPEILSDASRLDELIRLDASFTAAIEDAVASLEGDASRDSTVIEIARQLGAAERRLGEEAERFNHTVESYNLLIERFPLSAFARVYGFEPMPVLDVPSMSLGEAADANGETSAE